MAKKKPKPGESLAEKYPAVTLQLHPDLNEDLDPFLINPGSNAKMWWLGPCTHAWDAPVYSRVAGSQCPFCRGLRVLIGFNDICTTEPEVAREWHPTRNEHLSPTQVTRGSHKKVWWLGESCGHEWRAPVDNRCGGTRTGCPYCAGVLLLEGFNDLQTLFPAIAAQWHPTKNGTLLPSQRKHGSKDRVWWLSTTCGHSWDATINDRTNSGHGCPFCSGHRVLTGFNDLATVYPATAKQWHPTKNGKKIPSLSHAASDTKRWWLCSVGHSWQAVVKLRTLNGIGCPTCAKEAGHHTSLAEMCLRDALARRYSGTHSDGVDLPRSGSEKAWLCDILIEQTDGRRAVIEYDGHPSHALPRKVAFDAAKSEDLRAQGYLVIRIRPHTKGSSLPALHSHDIHITNRQAHHSRADWMAERVTERLISLGLHPDLDTVDHVDEGLPQSVA